MKMLADSLIKELKELNQIVPIIRLSVDCININKDNIGSFLTVMADIKNCEIVYQLCAARGVIYSLRKT